MDGPRLLTIAVIALTLTGLATSAPDVDRESLCQTAMASALAGPGGGEHVVQTSAQPAGDYVRFEGSHVVIELFPEHAPLLNDPHRWLDQLDVVYEAFADLVGGVPFAGEKITIREVAPMPYVAVSGNPIQWNTDYVVSGIDTLNNGGLRTGIFHEMSHDFDLAGWEYVTQVPAANAEHWANFKELYALDRLSPLYPDAWYGLQDGSQPVPLSQFGEAYFVKKFAEPYLPAGSRDWQTMPTDVFTGLFYLLVQQLGWGPFRETFRDYLAGRFDQGAVTTDEGKINEYIRLLSKNAGRDLSPQFREWGFPTPTVALASLSQGWNHRCYVGPQKPTQDALAHISPSVQAAYRLTQDQRFERWFPARPDLSTITTVSPYQPLLVLTSEQATWAQLASGTPPSSVNLAQGWNSVCYGGQPKAVADATSGIAGKFGILYTLGDGQSWAKYVPGREDLSDITQLKTYDSVLVLVTQAGGTTWSFGP